MIQDTGKLKLNLDYIHQTYIEENGICFVFQNNQVLVKKDHSLPVYMEIRPEIVRIVYLFRLGDQKYYLAEVSTFPENECIFETVVQLQHFKNKAAAFAGMTAFHLYLWYRSNQFCGRCGQPLVHNSYQRMLQCKACGNQVYPKISPAVIVAVTDGNRLLMTRYNGREYKGYSLIAGFIEVGETAEQAAEREVMEEAGIHIKNLRYYKTQPWGQHEDLLIGYFAELDGDDTIQMDTGELSEAAWYDRDKIDFEYEDISLTADMIIKFKREGAEGMAMTHFA